MSERPGPIERLLAFCSSERLTAFLVLLMSSAAFVAIFVPQGKDAIDLMRDPGATQLRELSHWGLTDVFESPWVLAIGCLLLGSLVLVGLKTVPKKSSRRNIEPPQKTPLKETVAAPLPERAAEIMRALFIRRLGAPSAEKADGSRVVMVFESGRSSTWAPLLSHLGLLVLVLGAGLYAAEAEDLPRLVRAELQVFDSQTKNSGIFDMAQNESFQFFQWRANYILRSYEPQRGPLGPAVLIERRLDGEGSSAFWVYTHAPPGFDAKHRDGEVSIEARKIGYSPVPGAGLADSVFGALMLLGLALTGFGAFAGQTSRGRLWVDLEGADVRLTAVPQMQGDVDFSKRFRRWVVAAKTALQE